MFESSPLLATQWGNSQQGFGSQNIKYFKSTVHQEILVPNDFLATAKTQQSEMWSYHLC